MRPDQALSIAERIAAKSVAMPSGCVEWQGARTRGYARMFVGSRADGTRRNALVSHLVLELAGDPVPAGEEAAHSCDNPSCVLRDHLSPATHATNIRDRGLRGRTAKGEAQGLSKLTAARVRTARRAVLKYQIPIKDIADKYGVTYQAIRAAVLGHTWRHS